MKHFKFFQQNNSPYMDRCRLEVGSSFTYEGDYCTVTNMFHYGFGYRNQSHPTVESYMTYEYYLITPSAAGRQLNRGI